MTSRSPRPRSVRQRLDVVVTSVVEKRLGALPVVAEFLRRLDVAGVVDGVCPGGASAYPSHGQMVEALVANRLTSPAPLVRVGDWARTWAVEEVFGIEPDLLNDDRPARVVTPDLHTRDTDPPTLHAPLPAERLPAHPADPVATGPKPRPAARRRTRTVTARRRAGPIGCASRGSGTTPSASAAERVSSSPGSARGTRRSAAAGVTACPHRRHRRSRCRCRCCRNREPPERSRQRWSSPAVPPGTTASAPVPSYRPPVRTPSPAPRRAVPPLGTAPRRRNGP
ncbi:DUF4277 domain-containing protein [Streptomyces sp. NPDC012751]|uniref:DUF4277 domain-containing protein n=1 Tax=Streptomyces sp. NPDC012751 TaxID=3364846 RepID=UPI0036AC4B30